MSCLFLFNIVINIKSGFHCSSLCVEKKGFPRSPLNSALNRKQAPN